MLQIQIKYRTFKANISAKKMCFVCLYIAVYWRTLVILNLIQEFYYTERIVLICNCIMQWLTVLKHQTLKMIMATIFFIYLQNASSRFLEYVHNCHIIKRKLLRYLNAFWKFLNVYQLDNFYLLLQDTGIL